MLDMGFLPSIRTIVRSLPKQRQTLLFSATLSREWLLQMGAGAAQHGLFIQCVLVVAAGVVVVVFTIPPALYCL